jgi:hypothetical protein
VLHRQRGPLISAPDAEPVHPGDSLVRSSVDSPPLSGGLSIG